MNSIIPFMDKVTIVFAFLLMFVTLYNTYRQWKEQKQENKKIRIIFDVNDIDYILDLDMPRKHISRSEIQGVLAAFQVDVTARYSLAYLSNISFLDDIFKIQNNNLDHLNIKVTKEEFKQFDITKMKKNELHKTNLQH